MIQDEFDEGYGSPTLFYNKFYKSVIFGKGFGASSIRKTHQSMERPYIGKTYDTVLEIGGGVGEHLDFVSHKFENYFLTDIQLPTLNNQWAGDDRITCQVANAEELPYSDNMFDRVIATCLLHHVEKPESVLEEILRVLKPHGVATIFLSCDPGIAVRFLRFVTTSRSATKAGYRGYGLMIAREHRNHVVSLLSMLKYVFRFQKVKASYFPFKLPLWNLNGYIVVHIS